MIRRRTFLLSMASSAAIAVCLAGPASLMAAEKKFPFITGDVDDPHFGQPYIDIEEWREVSAAIHDLPEETTQRQEAAPVKPRYLYVHGGFKGTDTKFTFSFPPKDQYQGRFYQITHQLLTDENPTPYNVAMSLAAGAYVVHTNMGGAEIARNAEDAQSGRFDPSIGNYRANAAAAKYSRVVAQRIYERQHRPFGYLYGGSGGSAQTKDGAEKTSGVWDGFVPYVSGNPITNPSKFVTRAHTLQVMKDKWPSVIDAFEPGGGDPYAGLNAEQKIALEEATLYGFPPRSWHNYVPVGTGPMGLTIAFVPLLDPTYVDDFWSKPGYIAPSSTAKTSRIKASAKVVRVIEEPLVGRATVGTKVELSEIPAGDLLNVDMIATTGEAKGMAAPIGSVKDKVITFARGANPRVVSLLKVGDTVMIDNSLYLAVQTYYRHALPERGSTFDFAPAFDSFRNADGTPKYPQRAINVPMNRIEYDDRRNSQGKIVGKMIAVQTLMDGDAFPWDASWYQEKVRAALGPAFDDNYRLVYVDHAQHSAVAPDAYAKTHVISYQGVLEQALRDVSAWVEKGVAPPVSTVHQVVKGQVIVPAKAAERKGIQPVVDLTVNGGVRAETAVGKPVTFSATIEMPPGTGPVVGAEWDFEGTGLYPTAGKLTKAPKVTLTASHTYTKPGTYFAAIRATSQRDGDANAHFARVQNLGRVRVVVK